MVFKKATDLRPWLFKVRVGARDILVLDWRWRLGRSARNFFRGDADGLLEKGSECRRRWCSYGID